MTEKRFTIDDDRIKDNKSPCCYIEYYNGLVPTVDLLNELHEEKEIAIDVIKIADELIRKYGSDRLKHEWKKEVIVKYR